VSRFFLSLDAPFEWVLTNPKGEVIENGIAEELDALKIPKQVNEVIGVAPGQSVTIRSVMVPGKRRANVEAALPYALEDGLTEEVEDLHFTVLKWRPDQEVFAAIVSRSQMDIWTHRLKDAGIIVDKIVPRYMLLPLHNDKSCTISSLPDESVLIRTGELSGFSVDQSFFEYWLDSEDFKDTNLSFTDLEQARSAGKLLKGSGKPSVEVRHWDIGNRLVDWLRLDTEQNALAGMSLLHGSYTPEHLNRSYRPLQIAACCLLVAVVFYTFSMWSETNKMRARDQVVKQQTQSLFKQRFPGEPYLGRPRVQVNALLGSVSSGSDENDFQLLLKSISQVARKNRATIEEVNFRDSAMTVLCNVDSLAVLDTIRSTLQALPGLEAELLSSGARDNQVSGRFRLTRSS